MHTVTRSRPIDAAVLHVLKGAEVAGNKLTLVGKLDRKLYVATNDVLAAVGGKWDRKAGAHVFEDDIEDVIGQLIENGAYTKSKQEFGFFETPDQIVALMLGAANIRDGMKVLEPSAGRGSIALAILQKSRPEMLVCVEIQELNIDKLDMRVCNATAEWAGRDNFPVICGDFLSQKPDPIFDRVVMNPPFSRRADIHHITHALKFLKPGGRLVAIASASVSYRDDRLGIEFRLMVQKHHGTIAALPTGSFKESGTGVNTVLITMDAP